MFCDIHISTNNFFLSVITCTVPIVDNGVASPTEGSAVNFGNGYTVDCDTGYELVNNLASSGNCGSDYNFASTAPTCQSKYFPHF